MPISKAAFLGLFLSSVAVAEPSFAVLPAGQCANSTLHAASRAISEQIGARKPGQLMSSEWMASKLGKGPTVSLEEIQQQIDVVRNHFFAAEYEKALSAIKVADGQIAPLPLSADRWRLLSSLKLLEGLVHRAVRNQSAANEAFARVLRVEPNRQLDEDYFSPTTRSAFEKLRADLAKSKKFRLSVHSVPPGADVLLDGHKVGKSPAVLTLSPGNYNVGVGKQNRQSLTHVVELSADKSIVVDMGFEGLIRSDPMVCLEDAQEAEASPDGQLTHAMRFGRFAGAKEMVLVSLEKARSGQWWLHAFMLNVEKGQKVREGGLKISGEPRRADLDKLTDFILTGQANDQVIVGAPEASLPRAPEEGTPKVQRNIVPSLVAWGVGGACLATAGVLRFTKYKSDNDAYEALRGPDGVVPYSAQAVELSDSIRSTSTTINLLLVGAAAGAVTGTVLYFWPEIKTKFFASMTPNEASFVWAGTF
jgi:hypothetical protein